MSLLVAKRLSKNYGDLDVFENVNVRVEPGDRIGLVGPNGAGKTSLLRALARLDPAVGGEIHVANGARIGFLAQDPPPPRGNTLFGELRDVFSPLIAQGEELRRLETRMKSSQRQPDQLSLLLAKYGRMQEAYERAGGYLVDQRVRFVLSGLGLAESLWDAPLDHLSGGQRTRASLGRLLLEEPDLLLLDEPTNHLDLQAMAWLETALNGWKGALVAVSHDRYFLDAVATRTWDLSHRRLESYRGNYSRYRIQRGERLALWRKQYDSQQKFIRETRAFIRRYKAGQRTKEAQGRETRLKRFIEEEALPAPTADRFIRLPLRSAARSGDIVVRTRRLVAGYRDPASPRRQKDGFDRPSSPAGRPRPAPTLGAGDAPVLEVPDLELRRGGTAALIGPNGAGKTTLVRTVLEELEPLAGRIELGAAVDVGYLAQQHADGGDGPRKADQTVLDSLLEVKRLPTERARTFLGQFLFRGDDVFQSVGTLSGGQRSRIALARLTLQGANFLLLDEPTNHLDLDSQEILQDALRQFNGTILLVTHDRALIDALATEIWQVEPGSAGRPGRLEIFRGSWSRFQEERARTDAGSPAAAQVRAEPAHNAWELQRAARRKRRQARERERAVAETENRIAALEEKLTRLELLMARAGAAQDLELLGSLQKDHSATAERLDSLMEQWAAMAA